MVVDGHSLSPKKTIHPGDFWLTKRHFTRPFGARGSRKLTFQLTIVDYRELFRALTTRMIVQCLKSSDFYTTPMLYISI